MAPKPAPTTTAKKSVPQGNINYIPMDAWLAQKGQPEFALYQREATTTALTYDEWAASVHARGLYLAEIASRFWALCPSDGESEEDAESAEFTAPAAEKAPAAEAPIANGNGTHGAASSAVGEVSNGVGSPATGRKKRKKSKKKSEPEAPVLPDDVVELPTSLPGLETVTPKPAVKRGRPPKKSTPATHVSEAPVPTTTPGEEAATPGTAASPGSPSSGSATRAGLRTRTPAQQRPYFHHAKIFEEAIDEVVEEPKPFKAKSRLAHVSFPIDLADAIEKEDDTDDDVEVQTPKGRKKLIGKGKVWSKGDAALDTEFKPPKVKKSKDMDKGKSTAQADDHTQANGNANGEPEKPKKKRGRPPKARPSLDNQDTAAVATPASGEAPAAYTGPSKPQQPSSSNDGRKKRAQKPEEFVHVYDEDKGMQELEPETENASPHRSRPGNTRRWSGRKSALSSEFIHNSDDSDVEYSDNETGDAQESHPSTEAQYRDQLPSSGVDPERGDDDSEGELSDIVISPGHTRRLTANDSTRATGTVPSPGTAQQAERSAGSANAARRGRRKSKYTFGRDGIDATPVLPKPTMIRRKKHFLSAELIVDDSDDDEDEFEKAEATDDENENENTQGGGDVEMADAPEESMLVSGESDKEEETPPAQNQVGNDTNENGTNGDAHDQENDVEGPAPATTPRRTPGRPRKTPQSARAADVGSTTQGTPSKRGKKKSL